MPIALTPLEQLVVAVATRVTGEVVVTPFTGAVRVTLPVGGFVVGGFVGGGLVVLAMAGDWVAGEQATNPEIPTKIMAAKQKMRSFMPAGLLRFYWF